ncbi:hypothetical protein B5X24_HaOG200720 [Helicoverpa armigera]|uniref:Gustatory receptor n=1 Tax=Helicoverpa armigera TaxID=29058 RepID=A0A2W1BW97_HELAM|nr:hypothetical protein B5X24_HaOG200720 [Helicoverpa armigera]
MLFTSKFSIAYNCIRPHRFFYYVFSFIGVLTFILYHLQRLFNGNFATYNYLSLAATLNVFFVVIPFPIFYTLNVLQREDNVEIILKIQNALKIINYKRYMIRTYWNWFYIIRHLIAYLIIVCITRNSQIAIYYYTLNYVDVNVIYGVIMIELIRDGVIIWVSEVEHYSKLCLDLNEETYNKTMKKLFHAYISLMEAFDIFKGLFQYSVSFYVISWQICFTRDHLAPVGLHSLSEG